MTSNSLRHALSLWSLLAFSTSFVSSQFNYNPYLKISPVFRPDEHYSPLNSPVYVRSSDSFIKTDNFRPISRRSDLNDDQEVNNKSSHRPVMLSKAEELVVSSRSSQSAPEPAIAASVPVAATPASGRRNQTSSAKPGAMDELREKVMEQVYEKLRIFASAFLSNSGRQDIKKRVPVNVDTVNNLRPQQSQMLWASRLPFLRPLQNNGPVAPINPNSWCGSVHTAFMQYTQLNIWLLAAFILFPVTIPLYFTGFFVLLLFRAAFCATGWKSMIGNVVFRLANLNY